MGSWKKPKIFSSIQKVHERNRGELFNRSRTTSKIVSEHNEKSQQFKTNKTTTNPFNNPRPIEADLLSFIFVLEILGLVTYTIPFSFHTVET